MSTDTIRIDHPLARGTEVKEEDLWEFPEGLIGLARHRRFALVDIPAAPPFRLLASLDDPSFGIVVVEPSRFVPGYEIELGARELSPLVERDLSRLLVVVPVVLPDDSTPLSLNLKGPIVLSLPERRGIQRVSRDERHAIRWTPKVRDRGASPCSS